MRRPRAGRGEAAVDRGAEPLRGSSDSVQMSQPSGGRAMRHSRLASTGPQGCGRRFAAPEPGRPRARRAWVPQRAHGPVRATARYGPVRRARPAVPPRSRSDIRLRLARSEQRASHAPQSSDRPRVAPRRWGRQRARRAVPETAKTRPGSAGTRGRPGDFPRPCARRQRRCAGVHPMAHRGRGRRKRSAVKCRLALPDRPGWNYRARQTGRRPPAHRCAAACAGIA